METCSFSGCRKKARIAIVHSSTRVSWMCKEHACSYLMQGGIKYARVYTETTCRMR